MHIPSKSAAGPFRRAARWAIRGIAAPLGMRRAPLQTPRYLYGLCRRSVASPRILILSASVGSGHVRAAEALAMAIRSICPSAGVTHVDILTQTNRLLRRAMARGYFQLVEQAPHLVACLYDRLDGEGTCCSRPGDRLRLIWERLNFAGVRRLVLSQPWDLIVNTHFTSAAIVSGLRQSGELNTAFTTVVTDYDVHRLWITPFTDLYFTATHEARAAVTCRHISEARVIASGIPIHPAFARRPSRQDARRQLGLPPDQPLIIQMAGGSGVGPFQRIHEGLLAIGRPIQLIACAGRNDAVRHQLQAISCPSRHQRRILGFTDQIPLLLSAADLLVSKAGGLTVSEAMACGTGLVIVDPIPGQETRNADFVLEQGFGIKVNNLSTLTHKMETVLDDPDRLALLCARALASARPEAAFDVARHCLRLAGATATSRPNLEHVLA
jgi:processive 1,2-diacylglycerol beta-glucosyltransferase